MSKFNELVDKALLERTAPELARGWVLYELLRKLSLAKTSEIHTANLNDMGRFDDLVAKIAEEGK